MSGMPEVGWANSLTFTILVEVLIFAIKAIVAVAAVINFAKLVRRWLRRRNRTKRNDFPTEHSVGTKVETRKACQTGRTTIILVVGRSIIVVVVIA